MSPHILHPFLLVRFGVDRYRILGKELDASDELSSILDSVSNRWHGYILLFLLDCISREDVRADVDLDGFLGGRRFRHCKTPS